MKLSGIILIITFACVVLFQNCTSETIDKSINANIKKELPEFVDFNFHIKPIFSDRCFTCHGPDENAREADFRLDTEEGAYGAIGKLKDKFAIVPYETDQSELIRRINTNDPDDIMPPPESNLSLSQYEKELLEKWILQGAKWKKHWAFILPENQVPKVGDELGFVKNDIDKFVLIKLEDNGLTPNSPATEEHLVRRLAFDITGLPPKVENLNQIKSGNLSINKYIDDLLDSEAYAERMTADWLDLARYSDTHGYQDDLERIMWPWRDWVIHAFNQNMPYDQFVTWQLAGDLLPNPTKEMIIATAFNRNHKITQEGGVIPEEYRVEYVSDRTQTFGTAFMGVSVECAKCHDHKYDPISQQDYYSLFAFFNNVPEVGLIPNYGAIPEPYLELTADEIENQLKFINNADTMEKIPLMVMEEMKSPRETFVLGRGAYDNPTIKVFPNTPKSILNFDSNLPKNRLGLSEWLFDERNPLTARVTANRIWQSIFSKGIMETSYDFGNQGSLPTHPELLDHLAIKIIEFEWDLHQFIKYIVSSSTYQQSSIATKEKIQIDPENMLLGRSNRKRLTAEMIRDQSLAISGLLNQTIGGPSVKPYQPEGLWAEKTGGGGGSTAKYVQDSGNDLYRRSIYTFWKRTVPPPGMMTFDAASRDFCSVKRQSTSTPLQALVLLNDPQIVEAAKVHALNISQQGQEIKESIVTIFQSVTMRVPNEDELESLLELYDDSYDDFDNNEDKVKDLLNIGEYKINEKDQTKELAALTTVTLTIFNLDESISLS